MKHFSQVSLLFGDGGRHDNNAILFSNCSAVASVHSNSFVLPRAALVNLKSKWF